MFFAYIFELSLLVFLALGIVLSLVFSGSFMIFVTIFLFGIIAATAHKFTKGGLNFPYVLLIIAFLIGYVLFSGFFWGVLFFFILGMISGKIVLYLSKKYVDKRR